MDMNKNILELIEKGEKFAVATILKSLGSTPRTSGSRMIVKEDGSIDGTIGGGLVEAEVIRDCISHMEKAWCSVKNFNLNREMKDSLDMVCGGSLSVLIETFDCSSDNYYLKNIYKKIVTFSDSGERAFVVSRIEGNLGSQFSVTKSIVFSDGSVEGKAVLPFSLINDLIDEKINAHEPVVHTIDFDQYIIESLVKSDTVFIFGCGHVGYKLAQISYITGFKIVVTDDRQEFANKEKFPFAEEIRVIEGYENSFKDINIDKSSYIVILTRGHLHDQSVLEEALKKDAAYIGMIGSRRKRDQIYENLKEKGVDKDILEKVFSPVGLDIGSETPAEIAVSIIAEIIKIRSQR